MPSLLFLSEVLHNDSRHLLFGGWFDNNWNCYLLDLETAVARQITWGEGDNTFDCFLSPDDRYLYYVKGGNNLRRVDLASLEEEVVYQITPGYKA